MLGDLGKLIVAKGFKKLPKIQKIARSGHTGWMRSQSIGRSLQSGGRCCRKCCNQSFEKFGQFFPFISIFCPPSHSNGTFWLTNFVKKDVFIGSNSRLWSARSLPRVQHSTYLYRCLEPSVVPIDYPYDSIVTNICWRYLVPRISVTR